MPCPAPWHLARTLGDPGEGTRTRHGSLRKLREPTAARYTLDLPELCALAQVVKALVVLGIIVPTSDLLPVRRSIAYFLDNFERQTESQETIGVRPIP